MTFVLDGSVTLAWCFQDERTEAVTKVLSEVVAGGAIVPSIWRLEVANGLQMAIRRKRIDAAFRDFTLADLGSLDITTDAETGTYAWTTTLQLAETHRLTVYDAAYLELAKRRGLALATLDSALLVASHSVGVSTL